MVIPRLKVIISLRQKLLKRLLPLLLGVVASLAVLFTWQQLTINGQIHIEQLIQQEANAIQSQLTEGLSLRVLTLRQMANRWEADGGTPKALWEADAEAYVKDFYGYQAIELVDPSFKVRWVAPLAGNEAAQNLDLNGELRRKITLQVARDLRQPILSRNVSLVQGGQGFLASFPLFVGERFDGLIVGVFQFQTLFESILKVSSGYNVAIYAGTTLLYGQESLSPYLAQKTVVVKAYDVDWRIDVYPTLDLVENVKFYWARVVLIGGLVLVLLLVWVMYLAQVSYCKVDKFKKVNRQLQWEIHQRQQAEIAIARLAAIVESSEDAIISKDLEGVVTSWNVGAETIFGYTAVEIVGQSGRKLIPADYRDEENEVLTKIQRGERIEHYDTKRLRKDGTLIDVSMSVSPIKDRAGNIIGASKIARNIADRKQAEAALRQSEERWELSVRGNNDGIWDWNVQTNEVFFSSRWKEMLGYEDHEIQNILDQWANLIHPDDLGWVMQAVQDHFAKKTPFYITEYRLRCKDGSYKWILDRGQALWDDAGNVIRMAGSHTDITERKQAEVALQVSEARYRQLIDNLNAGFVIHATDTSVQLCNETAAELLGLSMDQMLGKTAISPTWHFVREDGSFMPLEQYPVNQVLSTGSSIKNYVLGIKRRSDSFVCVLVNAYPELDQKGQIQRVVVTFIDISQRKQVELEIQKTRNFLQALLDNLPVAVFVKEAQHERFGVFQFWNKTSELLFGISAEEALGKSGYDFFPTEQAIFFDQKDREAFEKGKTEDILEEVIDSQCLGKRWLHTMKIPIYDEQHQPQYLLCFSQDITDRKHAEADRKEMNEVMKNAVSGISKLDVQGRYLYVNKAYADMTGYEPEEMIGMSWEKTVDPDDLEKLVAAYGMMVQEGRVEVETKGVRKDGSVFYKQVVMISTYDEQHQFLGHYCFMKDISDRKKAELALEKELLRSKAFFNTSLDGVVVMDWVGKVVEASSSFAQMLGYTLEETLNLSVFDWDAEWTKEELQLMLQREEVIPLFETRHRRKDGSVYDVEISWNRVELEDEMMNFCICRDISDRKRNEAERQQAEQALRESETRFQAFMNHSPAPAWITDENGVMLYASQTYLNTFELPTDDVIGKSIFELYPGAIAQQFLDNIQTVAQTCEVIETIEIASRRDRTLGEFLVYKFLIPDLSGQMLVGGVGIDVTRQHQAETALQLSEERLKLALEASGDGLWDWNVETGKVYLNSYYQEMLGYKPGELVMDMNVWEQMIHPDDQFWVFESLNSHLQNSSVKYAFDYRVRCKSGEWKWIANYGKVVACDEHGKPLRMIGTHKDISDRKQKELALQYAMEAAEAANLAKSTFLANMSHELRTPLNVILGFAQVMAHDSSLTPNQKKDLQTIRRSGDHLLSLINDVLDLSKIESGHCTVEESGLDLIALLHSLRNMLAERASSKGLDLCVEIGPEVPQFMLVDAQKLRQVLLNLLSNAIKFTDRGSITLQVSFEANGTGALTATRPILQFVIADTGVGIASVELDTIFDAFVQAQAGKRSTGGTGLGLTISRKLLELMGGKISVSSTLGQGSTFTFTLPVSPISGVNVTPEENNRFVIGLAPNQPHHRILVVDDRAENRLLMVRLLTQLGLEVKEATNGKQAVQIWQEWQPDLTWMDIRMPVLDGYEATKQIRAMEDGQNSIIIALTAQASQSDRTLALAAGCNDYISKPFREQTLFLKMAEYLGLEYIYQEEETEKGERATDCFPSYLCSVAPGVPDSLDPTLLATLPKEWVVELEDAALCGDDFAIVELVAQLSSDLAQFGTHLTELAHQYQFEKILNLIQSNFPSGIPPLDL
ncbi:multi-sensor hybrid histidine kinase [Oscillatoria nigro-viridis PCC 7112]|uniref:Circadian input-output histidine kinase CikA n=1 Tax=Phormidium nigroviride PCC 7112 TaxID=179408 RepID=K9VPE4_9CYAN|nr:PAS domain S-box protein [Oscillatoria nigro-viridis]AFZ09070.1 multi-sensor hybrid histidine kinase [Oscillatoria nigro-viridis PCC 7112]